MMLPESWDFGKQQPPQKHARVPACKLTHAQARERLAGLTILNLADDAWQVAIDCQHGRLWAGRRLPARKELEEAVSYFIGPDLRTLSRTHRISHVAWHSASPKGWRDRLMKASVGAEGRGVFLNVQLAPGQMKALLAARYPGANIPRESVWRWLLFFAIAETGGWQQDSEFMVALDAMSAGSAARIQDEIRTWTSASMEVSSDSRARQWRLSTPEVLDRISLLYATAKVDGASLCGDALRHSTPEQR